MVGPSLLTSLVIAFRNLPHKKKTDIVAGSSIQILVIVLCSKKIASKNAAFTGICMAGWQLLPHNHTNIC